MDKDTPASDMSSPEGSSTTSPPGLATASNADNGSRGSDLDSVHSGESGDDGSINGSVGTSTTHTGTGPATASGSPTTSATTGAAPAVMGHQPIPKKSQQIKTAKPRPHICTVCTRAFARLEHLKRHERSHTNEKPFQCAACGRCFARRDLVLRHQQKLHASLPLHKGKDSENEHIIILSNNTSANAPLPMRNDFNAPPPYPQQSHLHQVHGGHQQLYSPPKSENSVKLGSVAPNGNGPESSSMFTVIPSPIPTASSHNTPPITMDSPRKMSVKHMKQQQQMQQPHPRSRAHSLSHAHGSPQYPQQHNQQHASGLPDHLNHIEEFLPTLPLQHHQHLARQFRHNSYSAASSSSYTNVKDALNIQLNNTIPEVSGQVEFATPQFTATEMTSKALPSTLDLASLGFDWGNIDALDLNTPFKVGSYTNVNAAAQAVDLGNPVATPVSVPNFSGTPHDTTSLGPKNESLSNGNGKIHEHVATENSNSSMNSYFMAHQFQNPNHPHHMKGTTPFEFGVNPPNNPAMMEKFAENVSASKAVFSINPPTRRNAPGAQLRTQSQPHIPTHMQQQQQQMHQQQQNQKLSHDVSSASSVGSTSSAKRFKSDTTRSSISGPHVKTVTGIELENGDITGGVGINMAQGGAMGLQPDDWLNEIITTPYESVFPNASHRIGFVHSPNTNESNSPQSVDEIPGLFRNRQLDLFNQRHHQTQHPLSHQQDQEQGKHTQNGGQATSMFSTSNIITQELRNKILLVTNLSNFQFPPLEDLNSYMKLYAEEFNKYFPFIHIPSLRRQISGDQLDCIPLLLSMISIGALYSFHDTNALSLFNLSKLHIHKFFERETKLKSRTFKDLPLASFQCLVLHIFISMFLNEDNMIEVSGRQIKSMSGLIGSGGFNKPLEEVMQIPQEIESLFEMHNKHEISKGEASSMAGGSNETKTDFDYFILGQSRIRTLHTYYMLEVFRAVIIGQGPIPISGEMLTSGTFCNDISLWQIQDVQGWNARNIPSSSIVSLSNSAPMEELLKSMHNHTPDTTFSMRTMLTAILYIHEKIHNEYNKVMADHSRLSWRLNNRPYLESLIKSWESLYIKAGGVLVVNTFNQHMLGEKDVLKLILPLYYYAKINLCVNLSPLMRTVWKKDWATMNQTIDKTFLIDTSDFEALVEATTYSIEIITLWTRNISIAKDAAKTSIRTPVFFVSCLYSGILIIATYFEIISKRKDISKLTTNERVLWLKCEKIMKEAERLLASNGNTKGKIFHSDEANEVIVNLSSTGRGSGSKSDNAILQKASLSESTLQLGIRILSDAPIWPIAMGLAEALKKRNEYISKESPVSN